MKERKDLAQTVYPWRDFRELRTVESVSQRLSLHQGPPNHGPILTPAGRGLTLYQDSRRDYGMIVRCLSSQKSRKAYIIIVILVANNLASDM